MGTDDLKKNASFNIEHEKRQKRGDNLNTLPKIVKWGY